MDVAVQAVFNDHVKALFQDPLPGPIAYLRRQNNQISRMESKCPTVATTRWLFLGNVCKWIVENRLDVRDDLEEKRPLQSADDT